MPKTVSKESLSKGSDQMLVKEKPFQDYQNTSIVQKKVTDEPQAVGSEKPPQSFNEYLDDSI